jgi:alcohol dehydrogenase (NADP+)
MPYPDKFTGFQVDSAETWLDFKKTEFQPKPFGDYDVDIKIECCGVCASDVHTINGAWGSQHYPLTVGHGIAISCSLRLNGLQTLRPTTRRDKANRRSGQ